MIVNPLPTFNTRSTRQIGRAKRQGIVGRRTGRTFGRRRLDWLRARLLACGLFCSLILVGCENREALKIDSLATGLTAKPSEENSKNLPELIDYNEHIRPILNKNCTECHGGVKAAGGVSFLFREEAIVQGASGNWAIKPGMVQESEVAKRIVDQQDPMPPAEHGAMLSTREVALIKKWIEQGAEWGVHWAYVAPTMPAIPTLFGEGESSEQIGVVDALVRATHRERGMEMNPPQAKPRLMRRISLDLIGLPLTEAEEANFMNVPIEELVDHLLASRHFGERWASLWMDLARYADSMGYEKDGHREIWPYRDYLIRSFNEDKPYHRFLIEQLAGDLLPDKSFETLVATAFHRNTPVNEEGGTDDEEFRVMAILDRNATTWEALQGVTMACVQCHSHPYDPIRHEEYYKAYAFLNNTEDNDDGEYPLLKVPHDGEMQARVVELHEEISEICENYRRPARELEKRDSWHPLSLQQGDASGTGSLTLEDDDLTIIPQGTVSKGASYQLRLAIPAGEWSAIKLQALVPDGQQGLPHVGFSVAKVEAAIEVTGHDPRPIELTAAFADQTRRDYWEGGVLAEGGDGWADFPRQYDDRWLVLAAAQTIKVTENSILHLVIKHRPQAQRNEGVLLRFRVSISKNSAWPRLATNKEVSELAAKRHALQQELAQIEGTLMPITIERSALNRRATHLFARGNWMTPERRVVPGVPGALPPIAGDSRLDFAEWIASRDNPLTARVFVNRIWAELFGHGIVSTLGDFGTVGAKPSHPELLDYLAVTFMDQHGWRLKPLLKEIVLSEVYQQSPEVETDEREQDPRNEWLARGPRLRLTAEMVRDQALSIAGQLSDKLYGPSVMPYQPEGIANIVYSGNHWKTSEGEDRFRRALYTYWRRSSPYPSMITFDAPSRLVCAINRTDTNTPLQSLVTLNDPVYFEAAQALALAIDKQDGQLTEKIAWAFRRATGTPITQPELGHLTQLYERSSQLMADEPENGKKIAETPHLAALTMVAKVILNLDATLTK